MTDHFVNGNSIVPPYPEGMERAVFGMATSPLPSGCNSSCPTVGIRMGEHAASQIAGGVSQRTR